MVLVTGGNGVIGGQLTRLLLEKGFPVRIFGLPRPFVDAELQRLGAVLRHGDITCSEDVDDAMRGVGTVYHLAALLSSPENPARFRRINVEGTRQVLRAAAARGAGHFIFVSSISVIYPRRNPYSASKFAAEEKVKRSSLPWTIARPCLVLGGAEHRAFLSIATRWPWLPLPRRGRACKRPLTALDLAEALTRMENNPRCPGKTYSVGGSETVSLRAMAEAEWERTGKSKPIFAVPLLPLRLLASAVEFASRLLGKRLSWLCQQSLDGLVFDANPDIRGLREDLDFVPAGFGEFSAEPSVAVAA